MAQLLCKCSILSISNANQSYLHSPYPIHLHTKNLLSCFFFSSSCFQFSKSKSTEMAATTSAFSPARINAAVVSIGYNKTPKRDSKVVYIRGLNSYEGLKAHNNVVSLGMPLCAQQCFANVISSIRASSSNGKGKGGGALSSKCGKIDEIFTIAATMNGLVLIGVAVGFVLLRIEAFIEESAD